MKSFKINIDILNLVEVKVDNSLELIGRGYNLINWTLIVQTLRSTWDLMKLKSFCKAKDTINKGITAGNRMRKHLHQPYI